MKGKLALCLAALLLTAVSCKVDSLQDGRGLSSAEDGPIVMRCVFAGNEDSRVSVSDAGKTRWEAGDAIYVHGKSSKYAQTVTLKASDISADGKWATITLSSWNKKENGYDPDGFYAAYPAGAIGFSSNESCYYYNKFSNTSAPLMAAYQSGDSFVFFNLCGIISFSAEGDFDTFALSGRNGETVAYSSYQVKVTSAEQNWRHAVSGAATRVEMAFPGSGEPCRVYLPGGTDFTGGFTLEFLKGGKIVKTLSTTSAVNVRRSAILSLGDVTSRLEDYTPAEIGTHCKEEFLGQRPMIIAYLTEYTSASTLDATQLTHINYAHGRFVNPTTGDGGIRIEGADDLLPSVMALKQGKPSLKVLLMIGGWGEKADGFSEMAKDPDKRTGFCQSCLSHIQTYGFDGIDIDWEYPTYPARGNGADPSDTQNFNLVLQELRETIGDEKIISFASSASADYVDWPTAITYLDYVNVMTYDMGNPPYHNSPLYRSSLTKSRSCEESIDKHHQKGVPYERLVLGVPFYGHGIDPYASDVKFRDMAAILSATSGTYAGKNIRVWDDVAKVPYLTDTEGTMLLGYDDEESVSWKGRFALSKGLLGAMFWEYRHDDSSGTLRRALCRALYSGAETTTE